MAGRGEAEAAELLKLYDKGMIGTAELMGPLTAATARVNPAVPRAARGKVAPTTAAAAAVEPDDEPNRTLVQHVHPDDYQNASPANEYDLVVVGAGVAGLLSVIIAKALGKRCAMIERHYMGGDCLNVGCFPSKVLIASAQRAHDARNAVELGVSVGEVKVDFPRVMQRMRELRAQIAPVDSVARYKRDFCDEIFLGQATFVDGKTIKVAGGPHGDVELKFGRAMVATGASPLVPDIPGLADTPHLTNANFFNLSELPPRLVVIGGGPIGMELAQAMQRLGSAVTVLVKGPNALSREDPDAAELVMAALQADGVAVHTNVTFVSVEATEGDIFHAPFKAYTVTVELNGKRTELTADAILNGTGRVPNVAGLGLEAADVEFDAGIGVLVDPHYRSTNPAVYACGDVASPFKFTHSADFSARLAIRNMFLGDTNAEDQLVIPWCTYTDPEIAHVGKYEAELKAAGVPHETFLRPLSHVDRYICEGTNKGLVKMHVREGTDEILGCTIVSSNAGDMISEVTACIQYGLGAAKLGGVIHPYPTHQEAVRQCAAQYNKHFKTEAHKAALREIMARHEAAVGGEPAAAKTE
mmetsp:Transcript_30134/g.90278  ORF Transcript_30134/g.90278 Transcript_30134/m.90278 type:complete len:585 (-) Transcript_30134:63-1817(-)